MAKGEPISVGTRYGRWVILEEVDSSSLHVRRIRCHCDCGVEKIVVLRGLRDGSSKSCGCLAREVSRERLWKHGEGGDTSSEYRVWAGMKSRCYSLSNPQYFRYGARGISVCDRWLNSFQDFLVDVGRKPGPEYSLDRIDNLRGYEPENVRWATAQQQARNRRSNKLITYNGETHLLIEWAETTGIPSGVLRRRLFEAGWSPKRALTTPPGTEWRYNTRDCKSNVRITYNGETRVLAEWAEITGIPYSTLRARFQHAKWTPERALTTPVRGHKEYSNRPKK